MVSWNERWGVLVDWARDENVNKRNYPLYRIFGGL
jgi:hypothetical protein